MKTKTRFILIFLVLILTFTVIGCGRNESDKNASQETESQQDVNQESKSPAKNPIGIDIAIRTLPNNLDAYAEGSTTSKNVAGHYYDTLIDYDEDYKLVPNIATSWEQIDETTWVFEISDDFIFSNGDPLTTDDVVFSLMRIKELPNTAAIGTYFVDAVADGNKVILNLTEPNNFAFTEIVFGTYIYNKSYIEEKGEIGFTTEVCGTGPYAVTEFVPGGFVKMEVWEGYPFDKPQIHELRFNAVPESSGRYIAVETGEVQCGLDVSDQEMLRAIGNPDVKEFETPTFTTRLLGFNCEKPPFDNKNVRRAIGYAIDKDEYCLIDESLIPIDSIIHESFDLYHKSDNMPEFNLEKAKQLLKEEGYNESNPLEFDVVTYKNFPNLEALQATLKSIGVTMNINIIDMGVFIQSTTAGDYQVLDTFRFTIDGNPFFWASFFHSKNINSANFSRYSNPECDEVLDAAYTTMDNDIIKQKFVELQDIIAEDVPLYPIANQILYTVMDPNLEDVIVTKGGRVSFREAVYNE